MKRPSSPSSSSPITTRSVLLPINPNTLNSISSSSPHSTIQSTSNSSNLTTPQNSNQNQQHRRTTSSSSAFSTHFSTLFDASSSTSSSRINKSSPTSNFDLPSSSAASSVHDIISKQKNDSLNLRDASIRSGSEEGSVFKKRKFGNVNLISHFNTERKIKELIPGNNAQISVFEMNRLREMGIRVGARHISSRPYLSDFVSHNEKHVFRCQTSNPDSDYAAPYSLAFSKGAKAGGKSIFAVGDHDGNVTFIDAGENSRWHAAQARNHIQAHGQAVFDVLWSDDDQTIATVSGDSSARLFDVETKACTGSLFGHTGTIKKIDWNPSNSNILSTASRDGSIRIWDRRIAGTDSTHRRGSQVSSAQSIATVNHIKNAHGTKGRPTKGFSAVKSVTSIAFLPQRETLLASSGSYDGTIKVWDLRRSHSRRVNPEELESNEVAVSGLALPRSYGICSLALSANGQKLFAYSRDSKIYAFDPLNLTQAAPLNIYSDKRMICDTFFVHLAVSPCSRYLSCGSSDGGVYLFDTEGQGNDAVKLTGHEQETVAVDWGKDKIISCSDDTLVRVWNYDSVLSRKAREDQVTRWRVSGIEES